MNEWDCLPIRVRVAGQISETSLTLDPTLASRHAFVAGTTPVLRSVLDPGFSATVRLSRWLATVFCHRSPVIPPPHRKGFPARS